MPIYRGTQAINKLFRGDKEIVKVYRGEQQVFSSKNRVLLFVDGITPIYKAKYVSSNFSSYTTFDAQANFDATQRKYEFSYSGTLYLTFYTQSLSTTFIGRNSVRLGRTATNVPFLNDNNINKVVINKDKIYFNNVFIQSVAIGEVLETITTQKLNANGCSFYEMKIYDNDVLTYHFVPAYQILSNGNLLYGIAELTNNIFVNNGDLIGEPEYE